MHAYYTILYYIVSGAYSQESVDRMPKSQQKGGSECSLLVSLLGYSMLASLHCYKLSAYTLFR